MKNITTPLGGIASIDKVEKEYGLVTEFFSNIGESKDFVGRVKVIKITPHSANPNWNYTLN